MNVPVLNQPSSRIRTNDIYIDTYPNSISPYGPPVVLGPIVPSQPGMNGVGAQPTFMTCYVCNQEIKTVICHRPTMKTHLLAAALCIVGCWPCIWIPYCMYSCAKTDHYCPHCSAFMGSFIAD